MSRFFLDKSDFVENLEIERGENSGLYLDPITELHSSAMETVHSAVLTGLAEGAAWLAAGGEVEGAVVIPFALTAQFLNKGVFGGARIIATPTVESNRGSQIVVRVNVTQGETLVAMFVVNLVCKTHKR